MTDTVNRVPGHTPGNGLTKSAIKALGDCNAGIPPGIPPIEDDQRGQLSDAACIGCSQCPGDIPLGRYPYPCST
jgi:hypothetical protein